MLQSDGWGTLGRTVALHEARQRCQLLQTNQWVHRSLAPPEGTVVKWLYP
jgi:hypothetical protein